MNNPTRANVRETAYFNASAVLDGARAVLDGTVTALGVAVDEKAPINNPTFTGTVVLPASEQVTVGDIALSTLLDIPGTPGQDGAEGAPGPPGATGPQGPEGTVDMNNPTFTGTVALSSDVTVGGASLSDTVRSVAHTIPEVFMDNPKMTSMNTFASTWTPFMGDSGSTTFSEANGDTFSVTTDKPPLPRNGEFDVFKLFDKFSNQSTRSVWPISPNLSEPNVSFPISIALKYPRAQVLRSYAISIAGDEHTARTPKSWTIEGSNNFDDSNVLPDGTVDHSGATWSVLDYVVDHMLSVVGLNEFSVANTDAYSAYRMVVLEHQGDQFMQISELVFRTTPPTVGGHLLLLHDTKAPLESPTFTGTVALPASEQVTLDGVALNTLLTTAAPSRYIESSLPSGGLGRARVLVFNMPYPDAGYIVHLQATDSISHTTAMSDQTATGFVVSVRNGTSNAFDHSSTTFTLNIIVYYKGQVDLLQRIQVDPVMDSISDLTS